MVGKRGIIAAATQEETLGKISQQTNLLTVRFCQAHSFTKQFARLGEESLQMTLCAQWQILGACV